jgi:FKBP-type peptidyl-prolyl cis-trans isomerase
MKFANCMLVMTALLLAAPAVAEETEEAEASTVELTTDEARLSYAIGVNMSRTVLQAFGDRTDAIDFETMAAGLIDGLKGRSPAMTANEMESVIQEWFNADMERQMAAREEAAVDNLSQSSAWLEQNLGEDGIQVTASGLQYRVIEPGEGESPGAADRVSVHYEGRLINGTVFDSSYQRGQPATFGVNQVIPGWTEALQMMKPGAKYELFIPPALAYGEAGAGGAIPPNAALIFEVELLAVNP